MYFGKHTNVKKIAGSMVVNVAYCLNNYMIKNGHVKMCCQQFKMRLICAITGIKGYIDFI